MTTFPNHRLESMATDLEHIAEVLSGPTDALLDQRNLLASFAQLHVAFLRKAVADQAPRIVHLTGV